MLVCRWYTFDNSSGLPTTFEAMSSTQVWDRVEQTNHTYVYGAMQCVPCALSAPPGPKAEAQPSHSSATGCPPPHTHHTHTHTHTHTHPHTHTHTQPLVLVMCLPTPLSG